MGRGEEGGDGVAEGRGGRDGGRGWDVAEGRGWGVVRDRGRVWQGRVGCGGVGWRRNV